eukprot:3938261-Alexandrium_andersonii.AAC.1
MVVFALKVGGVKEQNQHDNSKNIFLGRAWWSPKTSCHLASSRRTAQRLRRSTRCAIVRVVFVDGVQQTGLCLM